MFFFSLLFALIFIEPFLFHKMNYRYGTDGNKRVDTEWREYDGDTGEQDSIYLLDGPLSTQHPDRPPMQGVLQRPV